MYVHILWTLHSVQQTICLRSLNEHADSLTRMRGGSQCPQRGRHFEWEDFRQHVLHNKCHYSCKCVIDLFKLQMFMSACTLMVIVPDESYPTLSLASPAPRIHSSNERYISAMHITHTHTHTHTHRQTDSAYTHTAHTHAHTHVHPSNKKHTQRSISYVLMAAAKHPHQRFQVTEHRTRVLVYVLLPTGEGATEEVEEHIVSSIISLVSQQAWLSRVRSTTDGRGSYRRGRGTHSLVHRLIGVSAGVAFGPITAS